MYRSIPCVLLFALASPAWAVMYTGNLAYAPPPPAGTADGLSVQGPATQWPVYNVSINWTVTDTDTSQPGFPWKYSYTFQHSGSDASISHFILETSPSFTAASMQGLTGATIDSIGLQTAGSGNPSIPEDIYGMRFNPVSESNTISFTFWSNRQPVWGDFYTKCGNKQNLGTNSAFNFNQDAGGVKRGFLDPNSNDSLIDDIDPTGAAASGSLDYHLLVPDSVVVPEPASILLLLFAGLCLRPRRA